MTPPLDWTKVTELVDALHEAGAVNYGSIGFSFVGGSSYAYVEFHGGALGEDEYDRIRAVANAQGARVIIQSPEDGARNIRVWPKEETA